MRGIVIYHSGFGNTRKVAESLANGIHETGVETECVSIDDVNLTDLPAYDIIAIGSPTHILAPSKEMKTFLQEMSKIELEGRMVFCFDTRNESKMNKKWFFVLENSASRRIEGAVKRMKMKVIRPRESALVNGREGPLYSGVEEHFLQIGKEIGHQLMRSQIAESKAMNR